MSGWADIVDRVIEREGGDRLVNDPDDPGGLTKFGISRRAFPREDIARLTRARAVEIYRVHYWMPVHGESMPGTLAEHVFDHAVTSGVRASARLLQTMVAARPDGIIGPKTLAAVFAKVDADGATSVGYEFALRRVRAYKGIAWRGRRPLSHLVSWLSRVDGIALQVHSAG